MPTLFFAELVQWLELPNNYGPSNKYQQWAFRNYIIIIMISKQLRAAKQLIPLNEYFKPKQIMYTFAISKEALKAIYATSYQKIIKLANQMVTSQYQVQYHLNKKVLLSITDKDQLQTRQKLSQLLNCVFQSKLQTQQIDNMLQKTRMQQFEYQMLLKEILEFNVLSPLTQSQIQEILDSVFDGNDQKLKENMKQLLNFDVKSALQKAVISDIQQQKLVYPKYKLINLLNEVLSFDRNSILELNQMKMIVVNILKDFQQKRTLVSELLRFDVQSLALPDDLLKGTDPKIFAEAKTEMQAYFKHGIILDSDIFTQERFAAGRNKTANIENQPATEEKLFIFHPTFIVTGQMFCILDQYFDRTLIYGKRGESKSVSIILKVLLQNEASKYVIKNQGSAEMKALQKYINSKRKMFYWNIDPIQKFDRTLIEYYLKIVKTVCKQCFEQLDQQTKKIVTKQIQQFTDYCNMVLKRHQQQSKLDIKTKEQIEKEIGRCHNWFGVMIRILKNFYEQKGLKLAVTIDQINSLFSHIRKANKIYLQQPQRFEQNQEWLNQSAIANFLKKILQTMIRFSSYDVFYNSSINIERDYIKSPSGDRNYLCVKLYNRELLNQAKIFYEEDKLKSMLNAEMEGYFKFEIQRTFGAEKAKQMGWASKAIRDFMRGESARNILMTPLQIRYFMEDYRNKSENIDVPDPKLFKSLLAQWDKNTSKVLRYINFLKKLSKRQKLVNIKLLLSLANSDYKQANEKAMIEVEKIRLNPNKTPIEEFETRVKKNQFVSNNQTHISNVGTRTEEKQSTSEKIDISEIQGALDKQNFQIVERGNKKCVKAIQFCHRDIIAILQQIGQIDKQVPIQEYCKQQVNRALQFERNKGTIGNLVESHLLMNLVQGSKSLQFGNKKFSIERKYPFQMITNINQNLFMQNIFQNLQKQKENYPAQQMKTTLFIPFPMNDGPMIKEKLYQISPRTVSMRSPNSKGIDFLIVQKSKQVLDESNQPGKDSKQEVFAKTNISMSFFQITTQQGNLKDKLLEALESVSELVSKGQLSNKNFQVVNINLFVLLENSNVHIWKKQDINENYITELFDNQLEKNKADQKRRLKLEEKKSFLLPKVQKGFLNVKFVQIQDCIIKPFSFFNCLFSSFMKRFEEIVKIDKERREQRREQRSRSRESKRKNDE